MASNVPAEVQQPERAGLVDVLGTWMLSILDGHWRYAHVGALRGDGVATHILGMSKVIGDDSLRRALGAIAPEPRARHTDEQRQAQQAQVARSVQWMQQHLRRSVEAALDTPWILDCDTTIKVLYGRQQAGAVVSYNPHKPGRPSHAIHTYWVGNLRMVLDAALESGDRHAPKHSRAGLVALLEGLPKEQRPRLVRGDCAFGNEGDMNALEELEQPYLFKLRQSVGVKKLIKQHWQRDDWSPVGQGWQACEDELRLMGWTRKRRVVVMRRQRPMDLIVEKPAALKRGRPRKSPPDQAELHFIDENQPVKSWEYAVLVCNTDYEVQHIGQLYRDRADCENGFDEIKNQWGWGGYTTHDIERCALSARAVALIYNWWSWYVRLAHPKTRLEAITSRPKLLAAVGRMTRHCTRDQAGAGADPRGGIADQGAHRQCPRRPEPHSLSRAAVGQNPAMAGHAALHRGRNARPPGAARLTTGCHADGLTEENRIIEFFDCSSPWTYLAFHRIQDVCRETGPRCIWRPILVGGVFNAVNPSVYEPRARTRSRRRPRYYAQGPARLGTLLRPAHRPAAGVSR